MESKWHNVVSDHVADDEIFIDAWLTGSQSEEGKVIAVINKTTKEVTYRDEWAKSDLQAQEVINNILNSL